MKLKWKSLCQQVEQETGVPWELLDSVIAEESGGDAGIVSVDNAIGLMQIIPKWHPECGGAKALLDPLINVRCGAKILKSYHNNVTDPYWAIDSYIRQALASYCWGPGYVEKHPNPKEWPESVQTYCEIILKLTKEKSIQ